MAQITISSSLDVMSISASLRNSPPSVRAVMAIVLGLAALFGLYGRFKGLGTWPLGVDEFYISRSIDNILRVGTPRFACGGYYTRGIAYQYGVAALRLVGGSPEFDGRLLAVLSSIVTLPAVFIFARRLAGSVAACLCVALLAVSVWEIEMARFARMYAPFQAVFAWYCVYFLRFVIDRRASALLVMTVLSVLGVLTWEGGVLMGAANLLGVLLWHRGGRLSKTEWLRLGMLSALVAVLFVASRDFRGFATSAPEVQTAGDASDTASLSARTIAWILPPGVHAVRGFWLMLPIGLLLAARPWMFGYRRRPVAFAVLLAAACAAALHAALLAGAVLLLAHLAHWVPVQDYRRRGGYAYLGALLAFAAAWAILFGSLPRAQALKLLTGLPDLYDEVIRPWGRTIPLLAMALAASVCYFIWRTRAGTAEPVARVLICLSLAMLLGAASAGTDRLETRYTFFIYPLLLALGVAAVMRVGRWWRLPPVLVLAMPLACFAATEDFSPKHIALVDSASVNFRVGMSPAMKAHLYPRDDVRGAAEWIRSNASPGAEIVTGVPNLTPYYPNVGYFFLRLDDDRYDTYVCADGNTERWSGRPVLYGDDALAKLVDSGNPVFLVMYKDFETSFETPQNLARWSIKPVWSPPLGDTIIVLVNARSHEAER